MRLGVVGAGRVGASLAIGIALAGRGVRLAGIYARRRSRAAALVRRCRTGKVFPSLADAALGCDVLLVCVPDSEVEGIARDLAGPSVMRGRTVLHTSGGLGAAALGPASRAGAHTGTLHPLAAFPPANAGSARPPEGIWFAVSGDRAALREARRIVAALRGRSLPVPDRARPVYHLAASLLANHATVLAALSLEMLERRCGLKGPRYRKAFSALLRSVSDRIEHEGPVRGLTGPASRGDLSALRRHARLLRTERAAVRRVYSSLTAEALRIARRRGDLSRDRASAALDIIRRSSRARD
jgi:predicted short-subunit dehydrogenase-like oxidoreductase (DUF2520 family)